VTFGQLAGLDARSARARAREVAETLDLVPELVKAASTLSGGQARRLHTGMALMHRPPVLFLDEPTVGADVSARRAILAAVRALADEGAAIVYTTHHLSELSDLKADIAILDRGRIVLLDTVAGLLARHARPSVGVVTAGARPDLPGWTLTAAGTDVGEVRWEPEPILLSERTPTELVAEALTRLGGETRLVGIDISPPSLESAFLDVTGRALEVARANDIEEVSDAYVA
jgi:ABC-2 type transport system ATP-binding protein